jgi:hypothetical protein
MDINIEEQRVLDNGGHAKNSFTGKIRGEINLFAPGDEFTVPTDFKVLDEPIRNARPGTKNPEFILVNVTNNGIDAGVKRLYPSMFTKSVATYDPATGTRNGVLRATGEIADKFRTYTDVNKAFTELCAGKKIKYNSEQTAQVRNLNASGVDDRFREGKAGEWVYA